MKRKVIILTISLILSILITGCVGTIKSANPITTKAKFSNDKNINQYPGILEATAISATAIGSGSGTGVNSTTLA